MGVQKVVEMADPKVCHLVGVMVEKLVDLMDDEKAVMMACMMVALKVASLAYQMVDLTAVQTDLMMADTMALL
jgi:hypothetical protein